MTDPADKDRSGKADARASTESTSGGRARLPADQRRRQLTNIGLELLAERPIHELPLEEVADRAGISRTLLFHYFPTKSDYYAAVVEAAGLRLLRGGREPAGSTPAERVESLIKGYLRLVESSRDMYVRLVRGAAGGDPAVLATIDRLRWEIVPVWLHAAGLQAGNGPSQCTQLLVRGWLTGLEEIALVWDPREVSRTVLIDRLVESFFSIVALEPIEAPSRT
ncbi:MAG: TetR/AcrR family transcriptional regulator [Candidatus Nanopelagicales bacterium]